ncbi:efflux RND transporter periplasmic adaptor subunit [Kangiella sediminilitoris]|uniref:Hemolysin D n=1 Tax=Kangiella sediminilitoris TaxID=1144748 RepID=A0A1B3BAM8_9GAMM|nr:efflux RND transporter periplasmic adaptor subunit [Kangiella sediminilitoris]AOE49850.1 hemolysin D [Kangiella sediminilitoris]
MSNKTIIYSLIGATVGVVSTVAVMTLFKADNATKSDNSSSKKEPLYWVAPMDANYKRDKPGKSPMGMDLVPVYEESDDEDSPGTVKIHPNIVNNLSVKTGDVSKGPLKSRIRTVGYIDYDETTLAHIHSRADGWIERLYVSHNGQFIKAGQPLYTLYSPALVSAQEEYLLAKKRNNQSLLKAAQQRLESLEFSSVELKKLNNTRQPIQNVTFYAKSDGLIDNLNVREGFYIKPGTRLMTIGNLDTVWVDVELFERQLPFVELGQKAVMTLDYLPNEEWVGKVDYIYPMVNPTNRAAKVRLEFENVDHFLKPNMFTEVVINSQTKEPVLQIPQQALIRTESSNRVVVALEDGKFKSVNVKTGLVTNNRVEIVEGLKEGDKVVTSGQFLIDSESSIDSDFERFSSSKSTSEDIPMATVDGVINSLNLDAGTVNISREAIPKWNRGPATMDFKIDDSIDVSRLKVGATINFMFEIRDEGFFITMIHDKGNGEHQHD